MRIVVEDLGLQSLQMVSLAWQLQGSKISLEPRDPNMYVTKKKPRRKPYSLEVLDSEVTQPHFFPVSEQSQVLTKFEEEER